MVYAMINRIVFWTFLWIRISVRLVTFDFYGKLFFILSIWRNSYFTDSPYKIPINQFKTCPFAGIDSLSQFGAFPVGTAVNIIDGCAIANMGGSTRNICALAFYGCSMGAMLGAISNTLEKWSTIIAAGLWNIKII